MCFNMGLLLKNISTASGYCGVQFGCCWMQFDMLLIPLKPFMAHDQINCRTTDLCSPTRSNRCASRILILKEFHRGWWRCGTSALWNSHPIWNLDAPILLIFWKVASWAPYTTGMIYTAKLVIKCLDYCIMIVLIVKFLVFCLDALLFLLISVICPEFICKIGGRINFLK